MLCGYACGVRELGLLVLVCDKLCGSALCACCRCSEVCVCVYARVCAHCGVAALGLTLLFAGSPGSFNPPSTFVVVMAFLLTGLVSCVIGALGVAMLVVYGRAACMCAVL